MEYELVGDSETALDDPNFRQLYASNSTSLTKLIHSAEEIPYDSFEEAVTLDPDLEKQVLNQPDDFEFSYSEDYDLFILFDVDADIFYFYAS